VSFGLLRAAAGDGVMAAHQAEIPLVWRCQEMMCIVLRFLDNERSVILLDVVPRDPANDRGKS